MPNLVIRLFLVLLLPAAASAGPQPPGLQPVSAALQPVPAALQPVATADAALRYQAFLAGAPVGEATVKVAMADGAYVVQGSARSRGLMNRFSRWRTQFTARGTVVDQIGAEFSYAEQNARSTRHVRVSDGLLQVNKNGRQRPPEPSPPGPDVLTALFVPPHCRAAEVVHTGRSVYRLTRLSHDASGCRYRIVDDEEETFEMELRLARFDQLVVPQRITVYGRITGSMVLVDSARVPAS